MRLALLRRTAALLFVLTCALAPAASAGRPVRSADSWIARPAAQPVALTPEETLWRDRLLAAMDGSANLANDLMAGGDAYMVGRGGGDYVEALLVAFRATGDVRFLDRVYQLTELARGSLKDAWLDGTTDGYTSWLWLIDPANATYYGKDINWLDESICSGNVALWTWALHANRGLDSRYGVAADFWRNWLENHFLAKWYARAGSPLAAWNTPYAAFYKPDTEPRSANWRLAHYLWLVTGNTFYRDRDTQIVTELSGANEVNPAHPTAFRWTKETDPASVNWQPVNYANYYMRAVLEMNLEGTAFYGSDVNMKRFAATFRDVVYANSLPARTSMTNNVNGDGSVAFALYAFNGFAAWDSTGFLKNLAEQTLVGAGNYSSGGQSKAARNDVFLSGYALLALSPAGPTATVVSTFSAEPQADGSIRIAWQLSGADPAVETNLYRITADGIGRVLVNGAPLVGGSHEVFDTDPGVEPVVTYELTELTADGERSLQRFSVERVPGAPGGLRLAPASPNPFRESLRVDFELPGAQHVRVAILDSAGRIVRRLEDAEFPAGRHSRTWDGRDARGGAVASGVYFLVVETPTDRLVRRTVRIQ